MFEKLREDKISFILFIVFSIVFFSNTYLHATTNRLYLYRDNVDYISTIVSYGFLLQIFFGVLILIYGFFRKKIYIHFKIIGQIVITLTLVIQFLDFAPCLYEYDTILRKENEKYYQLLESLLCPSYSNPGRLGLIFYLIVGAAIYFFSKKMINRKIDN